MAVGAIIGGVIALVGASQSAEQGRTEAQEREFQGLLQEQSAERERRISVQDELGFRTAQGALVGDRRAGLGASGVDPTTGSPVDVAGDLAAEIELQALRIRQGGQVRASRLEQEALLLNRSGKAAFKRGQARAGSSLLSGASGFFGGSSFNSPSQTTTTTGGNQQLNPRGGI